MNILVMGSMKDLAEAEVQEARRIRRLGLEAAVAAEGGRKEGTEEEEERWRFLVPVSGEGPSRLIPGLPLPPPPARR